MLVVTAVNTVAIQFTVIVQIDRLRRHFDPQRARRYPKFKFKISLRQLIIQRRAWQCYARKFPRLLCELLSKIRRY